MAPKIKKQPKIYLAGQTEEKESNFSRLQATAAANIPIVQSAELEDWPDDDQPQGWDELNDATTTALIREKRKELRNQQIQQKRQKKQAESSRRH